MQAKIIFLGTGGDSIVVGKQIRASGGIIIQVDDNQFHIDPGPGSLIMAKQLDISLRENTALLVSHAHINHCNDVNAVLEAMTHSGLDKKGVLLCNKTVFNGTDKIHPYLTEYHKNLVERAIALEPNQRVGINEVEVKTTATKHFDPNGLGFKLFTSKFILGYTSDTEFSPEIAENFKETDVLILNVQQPQDMKSPGYMCTETAISFIKAVNPKLAIITHFGVKMIDSDPLNEARTIQKSTGIQTISATDGLVIDPISYSANLRTKTLNLY